MLTSPAKISDTLALVGEALPRLHRAYYRLALVVGKAGTGKTRLLQALHKKGGYPLLNVNLGVCERLLEHTIAERPRLAPRFLNEMVKEAQSAIILLDNLELLFDAPLALNPLQLLQSMSRNVTLVVAWSGEYTDGKLIYAEAGHPEYREYSLAAQDAVIFNLG